MAVVHYMSPPPPHSPTSCWRGALSSRLAKPPFSIPPPPPRKMRRLQAGGIKPSDVDALLAVRRVNRLLTTAEDPRSGALRAPKGHLMGAQWAPRAPRGCLLGA